ncbi:MAG TPA: MarC family protein [Ktedonobacterales bacterium]|jgi:multiple antibiotic resistance protein
MSGMIFYFFKALAVIFTMVDPLGVVPVMIGLTGGYTKHERSRIATNATLIAGGVILVFGVIGRPLFSWLQVSTQAFDIAGGLLLFLVAVDMLFGRPSGVRKTPREEHEARIQEDVTVFPLAIPMIAGPGTITTVILLVGDAWPNGLELLMIAAAAAITLAATWVALQTSGRIQARLGTAGIAVLSRVLGMVLAAIAVQFVLNGVGPFLAHVLTTR